jgi:hypothetical protein
MKGPPETGGLLNKDKSRCITLQLEVSVGRAGLSGLGLALSQSQSRGRIEGLSPSMGVATRRAGFAWRPNPHNWALVPQTEPDCPESAKLAADALAHIPTLGTPLLTLMERVREDASLKAG